MNLQIHWCLSIMFGEHLSTFQLRTVGHGKVWHTQNSNLLPLQYRSTVSMAHFLSVAHLIRADPAILFSTGHQPCHRYTSWWLSTRNSAKQPKKQQIHHQPLTSSQNPLNNPPYMLVSITTGPFWSLPIPLVIQPAELRFSNINNVFL